MFSESVRFHPNNVLTLDDLRTGCNVSYFRTMEMIDDKHDGSLYDSGS